MIKTITEKLTKSPSFLRWSSERLANRYGCSIKTARRIKKNLSEVKKEYEAQFKD